MGRRSSVYWAGRATLVRRPEDIARLRPRLRGRVRGPQPPASGTSPPADVESVTVLVDADDERSAGRRRRRSWSTVPCSPCAGATARCCAPRTSPAAASAELDEAHRLMADLRLVGARRRVATSRAPRTAGAARSTSGATTRRALRTGGEPLRTVHRAGRRPAPARRAALRRLRLDGGLRPGARPLRPRRRGRAGPGGGVHPRHPLHADHPRAPLARPRRRPRRGGRRRSTTGRAAPASARACAPSTTPGACAAWPAARSS